MRVRAVEIADSPRARDLVRLRAEVTYDSNPSGPEEYWLDVPAEFNAISVTGDPWLAWLAPLAVTLGESLELEVQVSAQLLANAHELVRIWTAWYPQLSPCRITAPVSHETGDAGGRTGAFFSGGVDSFFTALRHVTGEDTSDRRTIHGLIFVWGFDIEISNTHAWSTALQSNQTVARELGVPLLPVVTNLRHTRFASADWTHLSHGAGLAGVAHALGHAFSTVLVPSSAGYRHMRPWGSHPITDPLFTSERVRIVHDGPGWTRVEKTEYIAASALALRHLRVCYRSADGTNCGACKRCYRTMLALSALGALDRCTTFHSRALDLERAGRVYCHTEADVQQFAFVRALAERQGRHDIVRAVDKSVKRSSRMSRLLSRVRRLRDAPLLWRWIPSWERRLLREWVV